MRVYAGFAQVLTSLRHATILGCTGCHIMIGAVSGGVTISGCERCNITLASRSLTVASCSDTSLYALCNTPPLIVGDSRDVVFAPHNTRCGAIPVGSTAVADMCLAIRDAYNSLSLSFTQHTQPALLDCTAGMRRSGRISE